MTITTIREQAREQTRVASGCETCSDGCECKAGVPGEGCGHWACWGQAAVQSCPGAAVWQAYRVPDLIAD